MKLASNEEFNFEMNEVNKSCNESYDSNLIAFFELLYEWDVKDQDNKQIINKEPKK